MVHRRHEIARIQARIDRLGERATELLEREETARARVEELRSAGLHAWTGRVRAARSGRALRRAEQKAQELRARRERLVEDELLSVMLALEKQSRRTRARLDEELARLAPVEEEWDRLRATFDALEETVATPALEELAAQWTGDLQIPEFPVREREGYALPFPSGALVF